MKNVIYGVSFLARTEQINRIVALDDFDVEKAASLREHLRVPGMGDTTARYFRDKLAMRTRAREEKIPVPEFVHVLNYRKINEFEAAVRFPYVIKPRLQAGAHGIKKISSVQELWRTINGLVTNNLFIFLSNLLKAIFIMSIRLYITWKLSLLLPVSTASLLLKLRMKEEYSEAGLSSMEHPKRSKLIEINRKVIKAMGLVRGVSHTEFIRSKEDGSFYFLKHQPA